MSRKLFCLNLRTMIVGVVSVAVCAAAFVLQFPTTLAQETLLSEEFPAMLQRQAADLRASDAAPKTLAEWQRQRLQLRKDLERAWGGFPEEHVDLQPRIMDTLHRDGYRVEKLMFQTLPGVWMTANAYVPETAGLRPAVLCVHGHWKGAKQDPHVQARCIGLVKLGFFVLAVDAMGAGERAVGKALGEYHGEMVAATLWPVGRPLSGLQVYENQRAVDYLLTRPEVDPHRLGITGASGGGNQTMYAGAYDERLKAIVPVCSVGNYQAYLKAACCLCEVVPGALQFTEEWGVLALTAPRALMVMSATQDAFQFSVAEAQKSLALVKPVFELYGSSPHVRHAVFESKHDYNRDMREAMYGWMTLHLKGEGDGAPITEPDHQTEEPEMLRCFPGQTRPDDWLTIPQVARFLGQQLLDKTEFATVEQWHAAEPLRRMKLDDVLGGTTPIGDSPEIVSVGGQLQVMPEPGVTVHLQIRKPATAKDDRLQPAVIVLALGEQDIVAQKLLMSEIVESGGTAVSVELRATGRKAWPTDKIGRAADHNTAEWSLWLGRPLLGQWVMDVRAVVSALKHQESQFSSIRIVGIGQASMIALAAAAVDARIEQAVIVNGLASYLTSAPYEGQRLGVMVPGILRDVGDIADVAALIAPRKLTIAGAIFGDGRPLSADELAVQFSRTQQIYRLCGATDSVIVIPQAAIKQIATPLLIP